MLRAGFTLAVGNLFGALLSLARNILIARLVTVEDFGIASTFAITFALIEMLSNFALNRLIVQAPDGDGASLQDGLHGIQIARGMLGGAVLLAIAGPYARLMGVPDVAWAYQVMALVPLMRGFVHLDIFRAQRRMRFRSFVAATVLSQGAAVLVVLPLAMMLPDWRLMLAAILVQQLVYVLVSQISAERRFRVRWDWAIWRRSLDFGLPLLGNGLLMFAIFHGDRIIVANQIGMETLGWFSVAVMLTLMPSMVLAATLQSVLLPRLAAVQDVPAAFEPRARAAIEAGLAIGVLLAAGFSLAGPAALILLFGERYAGALDVLVWLALVQALRIAKAGPAVVATARAQTTNPLIANIVRVLFLPLALVAALAGGSVVVLVWIALVGELAAFVTSLWRLKARNPLSLARLAVPIGAAAGVLALVAVDTLLWPPEPDPMANWHIARLGVLGAVLLYPLALSGLRRSVMAGIRSGRRDG